MESEAVSSTKIAIMLTIVSTLIFTMLVFVSVARPTVLTLVNYVINTTDDESARQYEDYDQKWVSGTKVLRALKLYEGTGFGIVYATKGMLPPNNYALNFGGIFQGAAGIPNDANAETFKITDFTTWKAKNAANDTFYTKGFRIKADGNVLCLENKAVTRHLASDIAYIQPDGRFYAELIRDLTGRTVGICFTQD